MNSSRYARTIGVKNKYLYRNILSMIEKAISEHRWNDVKLLVPIMVTLVENCSLSLVWKAVHMCMISLHVPIQIQMKVLFLFFNSRVKNYEPALSFLADSFLDLSPVQFQSIYEKIQASFDRKGNFVMSNMCQAFQALYFYIDWKQKYCDSISGSHPSKNEDEYCQMKLLEEQFQDGERVHQMLETVFHLFQEETLDDENQQCEWLLGPLLDTKCLLKNMKTSTVKVDSWSEDEGLTLLQDYSTRNPNHLPAWRLFYSYVCVHDTNNKSLQIGILSRIVNLCPQSLLVMNYIDLVLQEKSISNSLSNSQRKSRVNGDASNNESCLLSGIDAKCLVSCIRLVIQHVEFESAQGSLRAWKFLSSALQLFHNAWLTSWNSKKCVKSRTFIEKSNCLVYLWPRLFWNLNFMQKMASKPDIIVHSAYTAFMFGYDPDFISSAVDFLNRNEHSSHAIQLQSLTNLKGKYKKEFKIYMKRLRKGSNLPERSTCSANVDTGLNIELYPVEICKLKREIEYYK